MRLSKKKKSQQNIMQRMAPELPEHGILNCRVLHRKTSSPGAEEGRLDREKQYHSHPCRSQAQRNSPTVHNNPNLFKMCLFTALISTRLHSPYCLERGGQLPFSQSSTDLPKVTHSIWQPAGIQEPSPEPYRKSPVTAGRGGTGWRQALAS